jgi:hypothetical protein
VALLPSGERKLLDDDVAVRATHDALDGWSFVT